MIEVRIGVTESTKEISVELEETSDDLMKRIESVLAGGTGALWMTDRKGRRVGVPAARISYIEIDSDASPRPVGFAPIR